ncbi:MAG: hypothetical protein PHO10_01200 [Gemmiger sp.]|nr:hypothetical protein [Gemmiger sp.]
MELLNETRLQRYQTPYRWPTHILTGGAGEGGFDRQGVDIPFVFRHRGQFYMLYTGYDGQGYQSALATSQDLLHWKFHGFVLQRQPGEARWDAASCAATWILKKSDNLWDTPEPGQYDGKYWMVYHAYPRTGYENGAAEIGLAWTTDENLLDWHRLDAPILSWRDGASWEAGGLYKACLIRHQGKFLLYYNAKDREPRWTEQTGLATSADLLHFTRCPQNPLLKVNRESWDERFVSDPYVVQDGDIWLNFYFGYGNGHAQEGLAASRDLLAWEKWPQPLLAHGPAGAPDQNHAHKASMLYDQGTLYHFYCGTRPWQEGDPTQVFGELRGICVATSQPFSRLNWE